MDRANIEREIQNVEDSLGASNAILYPECDMSSLKHRLDSAKKGLLKNPFLPHRSAPLPPHLASIRDSVNSYYNVYINPFMFSLDSLKRILKEIPYDS